MGENGGRSRPVGCISAWKDGAIAQEGRRAVGRGIGANVEVEDSSRGTRGQLVGGTVEVQVDVFFELASCCKGTWFGPHRHFRKVFPDFYKLTAKRSVCPGVSANY